MLKYPRHERVKIPEFKKFSVVSGYQVKKIVLGKQSNVDRPQNREGKHFLQKETFHAFKKNSF